VHKGTLRGMDVLVSHRWDIRSPFQFGFDGPPACQWRESPCLVALITLTARTSPNVASLYSSRFRSQALFRTFVKRSRSGRPIWPCVQGGTASRSGDNCWSVEIVDDPNARSLGFVSACRASRKLQRSGSRLRVDQAAVMTLRATDFGHLAKDEGHVHKDCCTSH
jgi:hypothetical protein